MMCKFNSLMTEILYLVLVLLISIGCSKDNPVKHTFNNELSGTWNLSNLTIATVSETTILTESMLSQMGAFWTLILKSDCTFETTTNIIGDGTDTDTGDWSISESMLILTFTDGPMKFEYSIAGNVLTLKWNDIENGEAEDLTGVFKK